MATKTKKAPVNRIAKHLNGDKKPDNKPENGVENITIKPPRIRTLEITIRGTSPLMMLRFSQKAKNKMIATQEAGSQSKSKKERAARDFEDDFKQASYKLPGGGYGIPAVSFRHALVSCCRLVGFKMTVAKMSFWLLPDGYDKDDGQPLVRIISDKEPEMTIMPVRNATGVMDLRSRPMWRNWSCNLRIQFDEDQFSTSDIVNLLMRAGSQNGIGEGRLNSKESVGAGYGSFEVVIAD